MCCCGGWRPGVIVHLSLHRWQRCSTFSNHFSASTDIDISDWMAPRRFIVNWSDIADKNCNRFILTLADREYLASVFYSAFAYTQLMFSLPPCVLQQAERAIHQLRLNRLTSIAFYQAFIGWITSPICPHYGSGEEMAEHSPVARLLLSVVHVGEACKRSRVVSCELHRMCSTVEQMFYGDSCDNCHCIGTTKVAVQSCGKERLKRKASRLPKKRT